MGIVCIDTLGLDKICYIFLRNRVTTIVLRMERNELGRPASIYSMPCQQYPNRFKRSLCVHGALEPDPKRLVNSFEEIRLLSGHACIELRTFISSFW